MGRRKKVRVDPAIGGRIKTLREAHRTESGDKFTQDDLARAVGVKSTAVSRWETGTHQISADNLEKVAKALGVAMELIQSGQQPAEIIQIRRDPRTIPEIQEMLLLWPSHVEPPDDDDITWLVSDVKFHRMTPQGLLSTLLVRRSGMTPEQAEASHRATEAHRDPSVPPRKPRR